MTEPVPHTHTLYCHNVTPQMGLNKGRIEVRRLVWDFCFIFWLPSAQPSFHWNSCGISNAMQTTTVMAQYITVAKPEVLETLLMYNFLHACYLTSFVLN